MPLSVIGAGLGRTGTASIKLALEQLGLGPCYHMTEVLRQPEHIDHWLAATAGRPDWDTIFHGYTACVDYPACTYWRELAAWSPDARIVLSVRPPESWFESVNLTIMSPRIRSMVAGTPFEAMNRAAIWDTIDGSLDDRTAMVRHFERHVAAVRRDAPADRLLEFDVREGWEPLCSFLDVPVPGTPFPRVNRREEFAGMLAAMQAEHEAGADPATGGSLGDAADHLYKG